MQQQNKKTIKFIKTNHFNIKYIRLSSSQTKMKESIYHLHLENKSQRQSTPLTVKVENYQTHTMQVNFLQHNLQRIKNEHAKCGEKAQKAQEQLKNYGLENQELKAKVLILEKEVIEFKGNNEEIVKNQAEKIMHEKEVQIIRLSRKCQVLERENLLQKEEIRKNHQINHELLKETDQAQKQSKQILMERTNIEQIQAQYAINIIEIENLYQEKLTFLEEENCSFLKHIEELILELKIYEKEKSIEQLLSYENDVSKRIHQENKQYEQFNSFNSPHEVGELEQKSQPELLVVLYQKQKINCLMKEKIKIMERKIQQSEERVKMLQTIIVNMQRA